MAPLPKRKLSRQRGRERMEGQGRRAEITPTLASCPNCKKPVIAHRVCSFCGYYRGRKITAAAG